MSNPLHEIIRQYLKKGDYTGWFEEIYAYTQANGQTAPWEKRAAHPHLVEWAQQQRLDGSGQNALVTGCGSGDDAEYLAQLGFAVTAFDVSETAIAICKQRFPHSRVRYQVADMFAPPRGWQQNFQFVLDNRTIQSLPPELTEKAVAAVAGFVAEAGRLLILAHGRAPDSARDGVPWPLSRTELKQFQQLGLSEQNFEEIRDAQDVLYLRVLYQR